MAMNMRPSEVYRLESNNSKQSRKTTKNTLALTSVELRTPPKERANSMMSFARKEAVYHTE